MSDPIGKLCALGSPALAPRGSGLDAGVVATEPELHRLLATKNGFFAFESALQVFPSDDGPPGVVSLHAWNARDLWRGHFRHLTDGLTFFAQDVFGSQFALSESKVWTFDPETGDRTRFAASLEDWARRILDDFDLHSGYSVANRWQEAHGPLRLGQRLIPMQPFVGGGSYGIQNLRAVDAVDAMRIRAPIALAIRDLPDGTRISFEVED